VISQDDFMV